MLEQCRSEWVHTAEPLGEDPPQEDPVGERGGIGHHRRPGGRESRGRLEEGVDQTRDRPGEEVGEGTEDREHEPCQTHDHEALTHGDPGRAVYQAPPEDPEDEGDGSRDRDLPGHPVFAVGDGHQCGDADCRGDEHEDASEDPHQDAEQRVPLRRVGGAHALKIAEDSSMASGTAK